LLAEGRRPPGLPQMLRDAVLSDATIPQEVLLHAANLLESIPPENSGLLKEAAKYNEADRLMRRVLRRQAAIDRYNAKVSPDKVIKARRQAVCEHIAKRYGLGDWTSADKKISRAEKILDPEGRTKIKN